MKITCYHFQLSKLSVPTMFTDTFSRHLLPLFELMAYSLVAFLFTEVFNIGIKHGFSCINIRQVPWEVLKTEAEGRPRFSTPPTGPGEC